MKMSRYSLRGLNVWLDWSDIILPLAAMLLLAAVALACLIWSAAELKKVSENKGKLDELYGPIRATTPREQKSNS